MLIKFCVDNYLSFRNKATLDFQAGTIKEYMDDNAHIYKLAGSNEKLLKCLAVYGINSAGKTNLMKAFTFMKAFVLNSSKESQASENIPIEIFQLNISNEDRASTFEAEFIIERKKYRFGFIVTKNIVLQEWLFFTEKNKEENLYIRSRTDFQISKSFRNDSKGKTDVITGITRSNALFLSVLAQFNEDTSSKIVSWFQKCIIVFDANQDDSINYTASLLTDERYGQLIQQILRNSDLGFTSVHQEIKEAAKKLSLSEGFLSAFNFDESKNYAVKTKHSKYNQENRPVDIVFFDLKKNESLGTQRYFGLLGPVVYALIEQRVLFIDELDARLHTNLLQSIINLFNSNKHNPNGAQLIFTSHNPVLLKKNLRRDQIVLVEKDQSEGTTVNSLYAKDPTIRNDASFDKDFLSGKYVKVPKMDSQLRLF